MRTVFLFSGQGSQYYQMGLELYRGNIIFRRSMDQLDALASSLGGRSILAELYGTKPASQRFDCLSTASAAIFMVEVSLADSMMAAGLMPDLTLGVSLGTWAAAVVSGCIERSVALAMVMHQARVFEQYCAPGGMIAVLGDPAIYDEPALSEHAALAGINFNGSFVLAAPAAELAGIEAYLRDRACPFQRLAVGYPFHSHWIDPARAPLAAAADALPVAGPTRLPLACCAAGAILHELPDGHFWDVARQPIRLRDTIAVLEHEGPCHYVDAGPSSTLAGTLKYALAPHSRSSSYPVMSPFGGELANLTRVSALRP